MSSAKNINQRIHFIGIGGIGMSGLALILAKRGFQVSGSDKGRNTSIEDLKAAGVRIFDIQAKENINQMLKSNELKPLIVVSTAIPPQNPELEAAIKANLEIWHRSDLLAELINKQRSIAIAGTHGKTTTSTLITTLLALNKQDPSAVIGGFVPYFNSNCHAGKGKLLIAEADESDGTLVKFKPSLGLITNIELDHTNHYKNIEEVIKTMQDFGKGCDRLLGNYDCQLIRENFNPFAWWSIETKKNVDFAALPVALEGNKTIANIYEKEQLIGQINIPLPGLHNLSNSIAAIAACRIEGISFNKLKEVIAYIKTPKRRFEYRGTWHGRHLVDDYAHHPSEIKATISMSKLMIDKKNSPLPTPPKRLLIIFQPHRFSRTGEFIKEFAAALGKADLIILTPVYSAGEIPIMGSNSNDLQKEIKNINPKLEIKLANSLDELPEVIKKVSLKDDLILTMGAGDINTLWDRLMKTQNGEIITNVAA